MDKREQAKQLIKAALAVTGGDWGSDATKAIKTPAYKALLEKVTDKFAVETARELGSYESTESLWEYLNGQLDIDHLRPSLSETSQAKVINQAKSLGYNPKDEDDAIDFLQDVVMALQEGILKELASRLTKGKITKVRNQGREF
jgi:Mg/Co/Ni transporter MgtE